MLSSVLWLRIELTSCSYTRPENQTALNTTKRTHALAVYVSLAVQLFDALKWFQYGLAGDKS